MNNNKIIDENKHKSTKIIAIILALFAAIFFSISTPLSKLLLNHIGPTTLAAFLYLGAGVGISILYAFNFKKEKKEDRLSKKDLPYSILMIVLDMAAIILLTIGVNIGSASNASLLGNFEIVVTSLVALFIFKEKVSPKLWVAISLIIISSALLTFNYEDSFRFSLGSIFVILATCCWGVENNCTKKISNKSTYEIVILKGLCSGSGSLIIALLLGEKLPQIQYILYALILGFVAYGLSIFMYVRAQRTLGASKTSAYYAIAPFVGTFLSFLINDEKLTILFFISLGIMVVGSILVVQDTLRT